jgi:hypothetical protein
MKMQSISPCRRKIGHAVSIQAADMLSAAIWMFQVKEEPFLFVRHGVILEANWKCSAE